MSGDWWNESLDSETEMPVLRNRWMVVNGWWSETSGSNRDETPKMMNARMMNAQSTGGRKQKKYQMNPLSHVILFVYIGYKIL